MKYSAINDKNKVINKPSDIRKEQSTKQQTTVHQDSCFKIRKMLEVQKVKK